MQIYKTQTIKLNEKMLKGLKGFHKGLVEHGIILRSKNKNQTFQETMKKELDDMARFRKEMHRIKNPEVRELIRALTEYACAFYKLVQKRGIENYKETIDFLDKFYLELNDNNSKEDVGVKELIEALMRYIDFFNKLVEKKGIENYRKTIDFVNKFYFEMDRKYYSELEGEPESMKKLALYLNEFKL